MRFNIAYLFFGLIGAACAIPVAPANNTASTVSSRSLFEEIGNELAARSGGPTIHVWQARGEGAQLFDAHGNEVDTRAVFGLTDADLVSRDTMLAALAARKVTITVTFQGDLEQADSGKNAVEKSKKQSAAKDAVVRLLNNAQKSLGLSDSIHVVFLNDYHASRSEPTSHVTFTFEEHACEGTCTGHAFGKGLGEIFRHDGKSLYRKEK